MYYSKKKLFSEFGPISTEEWMRKIVLDLKGDNFDKKLVWKTNEGFQVMPFYRYEDICSLKTIESLPGKFPYIRGTKKDNNWFIRQDIVVDNFFKANKKALNILDRGITSLGFKIFGEDINKKNISILLDGIFIQGIEINFITCCMVSVKLIQILLDYFNDKNFDLTQINGSINNDFIGAILTKGVVKEEWLEYTRKVIFASTNFPALKVLPINAYLFSNAGAFITQELGYALAWGNELLGQLSKKGIHPIDIAKRIKFNFGISSNYFLEIAKFRAARLLWAKIVKAYEAVHYPAFPHKKLKEEWLCSAKMNIFAQTSTFNQTILDANVNLLRTQTEAMSASIAGVDSLLVLPFDGIFNQSDDFSERIARNQQLILKEECYFDKVSDVSGGSYYIESLTRSIALEAWKIFLSAEEKGFYELVKNGNVQKDINKSAEKRFESLSQRREILIGTNQFPNFFETVEKRVECTQLVKKSCVERCTPCTILNTKRLSENFEMLRVTTEKAKNKIIVFMLTIGDLTMRLARSQFSCNFFACAGYKVLDNLGFESIEQGVLAAREVSANIIVLCSSDEEYITYALEAHRMIENKEILIVAGIPDCIDVLKAKGISNFISVNSNILKVLQNLNTVLGVR